MTLQNIENQGRLHFLQGTGSFNYRIFTNS